MPKSTPSKNVMSGGPIEILETRIALNGTAIGKALGVPAGTSVQDYSQAAAIAVGSNFGSEGLLSFPTGSDDQFVVLSTGDATKFNVPGYSHHGTDWTSHGPYGDDVYLDMTLAVPLGAKRLKLDFMMLTQESPGSITAPNDFNDTFKITADADAGGAGIETLVDYSVNTAPFLTGVDTGINFSHRTALLAVNYEVPLGASHIHLSLQISDVHDGLGDTAVLLDNLRFDLSSHVVFLNFNGATSSSLGPGTSFTLPAFQPDDLGYAAGTDRNTVINEIVSEVQAKYSAFDVSFVTSQPASGDYTTVIVGGADTAKVTLNSTANPLLLKQYPTGTDFKTFVGIDSTSTLFGRANGGVDIGNTNINDVTVVFPLSFKAAYAEDAATREDRMVVTISHELGHALGLRHISSSDDNDPNIMKQRSPRSSTAGFEDLTRTLAEPWADGATQQNDAAYLRSVLGSVAASDVELGFSPLAFTKFVIANVSAIFGTGLYNAYLGVIPGQPVDSDQAEVASVPNIFKIGDLTGNQLLKLPITSMADKLVFWGQSTQNGPFDVFSGTPDINGNLNFADSAVALFDGAGKLNLAIPTAHGDPSAGPLSSGPVFALQESPFRMALTPFGTYQDSDGDSYTIKLTSKNGSGGFTMLDPDGDGKGPIDQIFVQDTTSKDKLTVTVKKPNAALLANGADGLVDIGSIHGSSLSAFTAAASDLVGTGIDFGNAVGAVTVHDILNGADISIGGGEAIATKLTAHVIGDGTTITTGTTLSKLAAARIGDGTIDAPKIKVLSVKGDKKAGIVGDFGADLKLAHNDIFLTPAKMKQPLLASATISGTTQGVTIDIAGSVGSFTTGRFVDSSMSLSSFFGTTKLGAFAAKGIKGNAAAAFDNSSIVAQVIGSAKLASVDSDNGGIQFGVTATSSIGSATVASVLPGGSTFKYDTKASGTQTAGDFFIRVLS